MGRTGNLKQVTIRQYDEGDRERVIELWDKCNLIRSWNDPNQDINRKLTVQKEYFFIVEMTEKIIGSIMAGYDGHRGSIY